LDNKGLRDHQDHLVLRVNLVHLVKLGIQDMLEHEAKMELQD